MSSLNLANLPNRALTTITQYPVLATLTATTVVSLTWLLTDFHAWTSFGTGGTPPTWAGYYRMTKFRIAHALSNTDLLDTSGLSKDGPSYLDSSSSPGPLPQRQGARPKIMPRIMPQRQRAERITPAARKAVQSLASRFVAAHPELLTLKPSKTEGGSTDAIYALPSLPSLNPLARDRVLDHEIAHAHPAEDSLHVWLSDRDAREVIEKGWGLRFPLTFVKSGWIMVYAPRDEAEVEVLERIVKAAVGWITGVEI